MYHFPSTPPAVEAPICYAFARPPAHTPPGVTWAEGCYAVYVAHQFRAWPLWLATCTDSTAGTLSDLPNLPP